MIIAKGNAMTSNEQSVRPMRHFSGVRFEGAGFEVSLVPNGHGLIGVRVAGQPAMTGYKDPVWLHDSEARTDFEASDIQLVGQQLQCLRRDARWPMFREGFLLDLELDMAAAIRETLPRLARVAEVSHAIEQRMDALMGETGYLHLVSFIPEVVAHLVFDAATPAEALQRVAYWHHASKEAGWMACFEDLQIRLLLEGAAEITPAP